MTIVRESNSLTMSRPSVSSWAWEGRLAWATYWFLSPLRKSWLIPFKAVGLLNHINAKARHLAWYRTSWSFVSILIHVNEFWKSSFLSLYVIAKSSLVCCCFKLICKLCECECDLLWNVNQPYEPIPATLTQMKPMGWHVPQILSKIANDWTNLSSTFCFYQAFMIDWLVSKAHLCSQFLAVVSFQPRITQEQTGMRLQSFQTRGHLIRRTLSAPIKARWRVADSKYIFFNDIDSDRVASGSQAWPAQIAFALHCGILGSAAKTLLGNSWQFNLPNILFELFAGHHFAMSWHQHTPETHEK